MDGKLTVAWGIVELRDSFDGIVRVVLVECKRLDALIMATGMEPPLDFAGADMIEKLPRRRVRQWLKQLRSQEGEI